MTRNQEQHILDQIGEAFDNGADYMALVETFLREAPTQHDHDRRASAVMNFMVPTHQWEVLQMDASL